MQHQQSESPTPQTRTHTHTHTLTRIDRFWRNTSALRSLCLVTPIPLCIPYTGAVRPNTYPFPYTQIYAPPHTYKHTHTPDIILTVCCWRGRALVSFRLQAAARLESHLRAVATGRLTTEISSWVSRSKAVTVKIKKSLCGWNLDWVLQREGNWR